MSEQQDQDGMEVLRIELRHLHAEVESCRRVMFTLEQEKQAVIASSSALLAALADIVRQGERQMNDDRAQRFVEIPKRQIRAGRKAIANATGAKNDH